MIACDEIEWRYLVLRRDNFTCQKCGDKTFKRLHAHHIKPKDQYPSLTLESDNGRTYCSTCHRKEPTQFKLFSYWGHKRTKDGWSYPLRLLNQNKLHPNK